MHLVFDIGNKRIKTSLDPFISVLSYVISKQVRIFQEKMGAQWLSGRVLVSRPRGCGFEPHWRHCVVVLERDTFILA